MFVSHTINLPLPDWLFLIQQKCFCVRQHILFNYSIFFWYVFFKNQRKTVIRKKGYVLDALETLPPYFCFYLKKKIQWSEFSDSGKILKWENLETHGWRIQSLSESQSQKRPLRFPNNISNSRQSSPASSCTCVEMGNPLFIRVFIPSLHSPYY